MVGTTLTSFAALVLLPAVLVLAAAPPVIKVGSLNTTIAYSPANTWFYANTTHGYDQYQGSGVFMFVNLGAGSQPDKAEVTWRTPGTYSLLLPVVLGLLSNLLTC